MRISKKRWKALVKRIADLEEQVQVQQKNKIDYEVDLKSFTRSVEEGLRQSLQST